MVVFSVFIHSQMLHKQTNGNFKENLLSLLWFRHNFIHTIPDIKKCTFLTRESTWASRYQRYLTLPHVT